MNSTRNAPVMLITSFLPSEDLVKKQLIMFFVLVCVFRVNPYLCIFVRVVADRGGPDGVFARAKIAIVCGITKENRIDYLKGVQKLIVE